MKIDVSGWAFDFRAQDLKKELVQYGWETDIISKRRTMMKQPRLEDYNHVHAFHPSSGPADSCTFTNPTLVCLDTFKIYPNIKSFVCPNLEMTIKTIVLGHDATFIPNLVNTELFAPKLRNNRKPRIGIVAKRIPIKGYHIWDALAERHPEYEWCPVDVNYKGVVLNREQMASFYQTLDLLLILSDYESGPNSLGEALASGVPVLSTKVGMCLSLLDDKIGKTLDQDVDIFSTEIEKILSSNISQEDCRAKVFEHGLDLKSGALKWDSFLRENIRK